MTPITTPDIMANGAVESIKDIPVVSARILKKRETDRKCQRMIRERTKSRIAYLESLVEQFRQQDSSGRVETLMQQLEDAVAARDILARKVKNIESIVSENNTTTKPKEELDQQDTSFKLRHTPLSSDTVSRIDVASPVSSPSPTPAALYNIHNTEYSAYLETSSQRTSWTPATFPVSSDSTCECSANVSALDPTKPFNKWRYANDTLTEWFKWSPQALNMSNYDAYNDDVPVRAIVEGWDAAEKHGHMHPAWRLLRGIDENVFASLDKRERLAILIVMGLLLQSHLNPAAERHKMLPEFYLKRPSQNMLHSYATEYFAWPGLRERFTTNEHRYCTNLFWRLFCKDFRFQWQYEFRDCYTRNTQTGLYAISPTFQERTSDIRCWSMGGDFFRAYPEFQVDIPSWNTIPASIASSIPNRQALQLSLSTRSDTSPPNLNQTEDERQLHRQMSNSTLLTNGNLKQDQETIQPSIQYNRYPVSSGAYDSLLEVNTNYNFYTPNATDMAEMAHITPVSAWSCAGSLDMYQINTA